MLEITEKLMQTTQIIHLKLKQFTSSQLVRANQTKLNQVHIKSKQTV